MIAGQRADDLGGGSVRPCSLIATSRATIMDSKAYTYIHTYIHICMYACMYIMCVYVHIATSRATIMILKERARRRWLTKHMTKRRNDEKMMR